VRARSLERGIAATRVLLSGSTVGVRTGKTVDRVPFWPGCWQRGRGGWPGRPPLGCGRTRSQSLDSLRRGVWPSNSHSKVLIVPPVELDERKVCSPELARRARKAAPPGWLGGFARPQKQATARRQSRVSVAANVLPGRRIEMSLRMEFLECLPVPAARDHVRVVGHQRFEAVHLVRVDCVGIAKAHAK
jgi:hypothetical protein